MRTAVRGAAAAQHCLKGPKAPGPWRFVTELEALMGGQGPAGNLVRMGFPQEWEAYLRTGAPPNPS